MYINWLLVVDRECQSKLSESGKATPNETVVSHPNKFNIRVQAVIIKIM